MPQPASFWIGLVALGLVLPGGQNAPVRTGAELLYEQGWGWLRNRRIGLITNHTALLGDTLHLADALARSGVVRLMALFGPEHGIRGAAPAGEPIADERDPKTGVPVYSLYGPTRKPTPQMLRDVEVLLYDIQDVGARFYTYISTMGLAMQAAAQAGIPFVVLDRPNPLGTLVEGPILDTARVRSFVGLYPIPIVYGLTAGELARMIQAEGWLPGLEQLDLRVIPVSNWRRSRTWPDWGRRWVPPSPNIPDWETALLYPGTCLVEGTTVSEGRGTRAPFRLIGAPWVDGLALARALNRLNLPGVRFQDTAFTPVDVPGMAVDPKHKGRRCYGVYITLTEEARRKPEILQPVRLGLELVRLLYAQWRVRGQGTAFWRTEAFDRLVGTEAVRQWIESGNRRALWGPRGYALDAARAFWARTRPYRLYPD
ncbi:MAG: DUF1343 domain-containing protein [Bacteroidetes bacterium]|nr:DUF1343 domain-containing protein [Rhodothermia bacterium]MCS7154732.1 DUF1343 domain-containing protein [Bacteroidota bacterium]MCX7907111.1 DUF1343 domain-containing protein [Bacteroidota bacterium]MDW8137525.1 DUF1343 domain-containing protein [Bacteroidota bacterium]MDW8285521.1 DUF1343 domain-containing protein [Bacteroidota bacterium]